MSNVRLELGQHVQGGDDFRLPGIIAVLDRLRQCFLFNVDTQLRDVLQIGDRHWSHAKAAVGFGNHEPVSLELHQGLTQAADADIIPRA